MATTKFYLDKRNKAKDGNGTIVILLYHNSRLASISTGIRVSSSQWRKGNIINTTDASALNVTIQEQKNSIDRALGVISFDSDFKNLSVTELKKRIMDKISGKDKIIPTGHTVKSMFQEYMSNSNLKPKTLDLYKLTLKKILSMSGNRNMENMDLRWLKQFDSYLSQSQKANGKSVYLRSLRTVMNYVRNNDIAIPYPFAKFTIKHEETQKRSLGVNVLRNLYSHPLLNERQEVFRDYFFLIFFLIGINTKDLLLAKKSQMRNGRLEYIREKTGKKYSIKIEPEALALIKKYKGKGDYLLDAMDRCKHYTSFAREINEGISTIGIRTEDGIKPLVPGLTTYWARHTWATLAYEIGIPIDIISQALGHSMGNRTTLIYVKQDMAKVDNANRKVIDYFFSTLSS